MTDKELPPAYEGVANELLPMWPYWRLPGGRIEAVSDPAMLAMYEGKSALLGLSAKSNRIIAEHLGGLDKLRYLAMDGQVVPEALLDPVSRLSGLQRLHLTSVRVENLECLAGLSQLEYLCIEGLPNASDISALAHLHKLRSLCLGINLPDLDVFQSAPFSALECLVLHGSSESRPARFATLEPLAALPGLEYLCLLGCRTEDRSLGMCASMPALKTVVVWKKSLWDADGIDAIRAAGVRFTALT